MEHAVQGVGCSTREFIPVRSQSEAASRPDRLSRPSLFRIGLVGLMVGGLALALSMGAGAQPVTHPPASPGERPVQDRPGGLDLNDRQAVEAALRAVRDELGRLDSKHAPDQEKAQVYRVQIGILENQLTLLADRARESEIENLSRETRLAAAREDCDRARAALDRFRADDVTRELAGIRDPDRLREVVTERHEKALHLAQEQASRLEADIRQWTIELNALPRELRSATAGLEEMRKRRADLEKSLRIEAGRAEEERLFLARRLAVRAQGASHYRQRIDHLNRLKPGLEAALAVRRIEHEAARFRVELARRQRESAQDLVQSRLRAETEAARRTLEHKQTERDRALSPYERLLKSEEVAVQTLEARLGTLRQREGELERRHRVLVERVQGAVTSLAALRARYRQEPEAALRPDAEEVQAELARLTRRTRALTLHRRLRALREEANRLSGERERLREELENQEPERNRREAEARRVLAAGSSGERPGVWTAEAPRWHELARARKSRLERAQQAVERVSSILVRMGESYRALHRTCREMMALHRRENLLLCGRATLTRASLRQGLQDLGRLPGTLARMGGSVTAYVVAPAYRSVLLLFAGTFALAAGLVVGLIRLLELRIRRVDPAELASGPGRAAHVVLRLARGGLGAVILFAGPALASVVLPDLSVSAIGLLQGAGAVLAVFCLGRAVIRELFRSKPPGWALFAVEPEIARRWRRGLGVILHASLVYFLLRVGLDSFGYRNAGARDGLALLYEVAVAGAVLALVFRRSRLLALVPPGEAALNRVLRFLVRVLHPVLLVVVPGLVVLDLLQFDFLAELVARLGLTVLGIALLGLFAYFGIAHHVDLRLGRAFPGRAASKKEERQFASAVGVSHFFLAVFIFLGVAWGVTALTGIDLEGLQSYLSAPLPLQSHDAADRRTWWDLTAALTIAVIFVLLARYIRLALRDLVLTRTALDKGVQFTITALVSYVMIGLGVYLAVTRIFDLGHIGYVVAALGVGIGFGLQEIVSNFVSGLILLFERPLKVGDIIQVGSTEGVVEHISIRATRVRTWDNVFILIPNRDLIAKEVVNFVYNDPRIRVQVPVTASYRSDLEEVTAALLDAANQHPAVIQNPKPKVRFERMADGALHFTLFAWISSAYDRLKIRSELLTRVVAAFRERGIEIPHPKRDVFLHPVAETRETDGPRSGGPVENADPPQTPDIPGPADSGAGRDPGDADPSAG